MARCFYAIHIAKSNARQHAFEVFADNLRCNTRQLREQSAYRKLSHISLKVSSPISPRCAAYSRQPDVKPDFENNT